MMVMVAAPLQRRRHFVETDRTVAILVHFAEHVVGLRGVGAAGAGLAEVEVLLEASNGFVELWVKPVACGDDDFAFVWISDLKASIADDAAPRASSIAELRKMPHRAAVTSTPIDQQTPCHREKPSKIWVFVSRTVHPPRQLMPPRQNFPPIDVPPMLLNALGSALRVAVLAFPAAYKEQIAPPKRGGPPNQD